MTKLSVPVAGRPRPFQMPKIAERKLKTGLRALVINKPTVPKVELQLVVPLGRRSPKSAADKILASAITSGTSKRSSVEIATELQRLGASLEAAASTDQFTISGSVLAPNLSEYLELLVEILADSVFPKAEIAVERGRVAQEIQITRSQPQVVAMEALRRQLFGSHQYGTVFPEPAAVAKVGRSSVRTFYDERIQPRGAILLCVGDVSPQSASNRIESVLGAWKGRKAVPPVPAAKLAGPGPTLIVDRPGSVQTNIRIAGPGLPPGHVDSYALQCANGIFGGTFGSRLTANIREDKGYTYSPGSALQHLRQASYFQVGADVGTEVTVPALVETRYELSKMAALEVEKEELESVQKYLTGIMAIRMQSQRGLAAGLAGLAMFGLGVDYLKDYPQKIAAVTTADVREASRKYLAPARLLTVLVGDASRIRGEVEALDAVQVAST